MGEEEYVDTIMSIDALLMQIQSDVHINDTGNALMHIKEARFLIADMSDSQDDIDALKLMK